jgi:hypothetical protein
MATFHVISPWSPGQILTAQNLWRAIRRSEKNCPDAPLNLMNTGATADGEQIDITRNAASVFDA